MAEGGQRESSDNALGFKEQGPNDENIGVSRETSLQQNEKPERNNLSISTMNENNWQWCENVTLVLFEKDDILNNGFLVSRIISNLWSDEICICLWT